MANYTVRQGDTLWQIAQRLLGDGSRWREIAPPGLSDPTRLQPGTVLTIPDQQAANPQSPPIPIPRARPQALQNAAQPAPMPRPRPDSASSPAPQAASAPPPQQMDFGSMTTAQLAEVVRSGSLTPEQLRVVSQVLDIRRQQAEAALVAQQPRIDAADRQFQSVPAAPLPAADATRYADPLRNDPGAAPTPTMSAPSTPAVAGAPTRADQVRERMMQMAAAEMQPTPAGPPQPMTPLAFAMTGRPPEPQPSMTDMLVEALMSGQITAQDLPPEAQAMLIQMLMGGQQQNIGTAF